jgi:hypothetical protein
MLSGLACLTRFAGVVGAAIGAGGLLFRPGRAWRDKWSDAALFGAIAGLPLAFWLLRNRLLAHDATTRVLSFHPLPGVAWHAFADAASMWCFQKVLPFPAEILVLCGIAMILFLLPKSWPFYFVTAYAIFVILVQSTLQADLLAPNEFFRILTPLHVALIVGICSEVSRLAWPRGWARTATGAAMLWTLCLANAGTAPIDALVKNGKQLADDSWRHSATMEILATIPTSKHIYTNGVKPVYLYTNRMCFEIPPKVILGTLLPYSDYPRVMEKISSEVRQGLAVVVYFYRERRDNFPSEGELQKWLPTPPAKKEDGLIFGS